eukprot:COSAG06_NODE_51039_length_314_cov_1.720930_1_plen_21_part_01
MVVKLRGCDASSERVAGRIQL